MRPLLSVVRGQPSCFRLRLSAFALPKCSEFPTQPPLPKPWESAKACYSHKSWQQPRPQQTQAQWQRQWRWQYGQGAKDGSQHDARRRLPTPLVATSSGAALATAAFVELADKNDEEEGSHSSAETGEMRMLEASRAEIARKIDPNDMGLSRIRHRIFLFLSSYVWEPLCTGVRFLHLAAIFVPVILAVPVIWIGKRQKDRDNERTGTLWWYNFLVKAMERAGPAFIKVCVTMNVNRESRSS